MTRIAGFQGKYRWLSNFWLVKIIVDFEGYKAVVGSVEHAYQASKALFKEDFLRICYVDTPGQAKRMGREVITKPDFHVNKLKIMKFLLIQKFSESELRKKLVDTGSAELVEENKWGDRFWGVCKGIGKDAIPFGENHLGKLLMEVRSEILAAESKVI